MLAFCPGKKKKKKKAFSWKLNREYNWTELYSHIYALIFNHSTKPWVVPLIKLTVLPEASPRMSVSDVKRNYVYISKATIKHFDLIKVIRI